MGDFTIQISTNLVKQLAEDGEMLKKKPRKPRTKLRSEPPQPTTKTHQNQKSDDSGTHKGTTAPAWPLQPPMFLPVPLPKPSENAEVEAIRSILQESERVVDKLQKQEEDILQEVTQRAKELHDKEFKLPFKKPMPCLAEKDACLDCYKEHAEDPLNCAPMVKSFAVCARRVRQQYGR